MKTEILEGLNQDQKKAVTTTEGPLLIIAGAGTGKTSVITRRIAYLIEQKKARPAEILALTFTEKAAAEMEERVDVLVPYGFVDTWISTFHAFGNHILQDNALEIGLPPDFKVLSRAQQILFFQQNLFTFDLDYYRPLSNPTKFIEAILTFFSRLKDEDIGPQEYQDYVNSLTENKTDPETLRAQKELSAVYTKYEQLKKEAAKLDFSDQINLSLNLLRKKPKILENYQNKFKYILIDEYQDTNYAQNELVKLLAKRHKNICVVGDDDQSIYKFRGASISNILKFKTDYKKAKQAVLTENFRSTQKILDASYKLIKHNNPDRLEVKNKISKKLFSALKTEGSSPQEITCETLSQEADFVASEIEKLVKENKASYKDIAILTRATAQAENFLKSLNSKKIPFVFLGASGLYSQPEIRTLIAFLSAISNFEDSLNLYQLSASEIYQMPMSDLINCMDWAKKRLKSLHFVYEHLEKIEELEISNEGKAIIEKLLTDLQTCLELSRRENVGKVLYEYLQRTSYLANLERKGDLEAEIKIANIAKFFDKIKEFIDLANNETVRQFTDYLETMRAAGDDPGTAGFDPDLDAVNVMTVHAAKGLEFKVVFLVNLVSERFPSRERKDQIPVPEELIKEILPAGDFHLEEERRLFYVGLTRAKEELYLTWSKDSGGKRVRKASPFIAETLDQTAKTVREIKLSAKEKIEQFSLFGQRTFQLPVFNSKIIRLSQGAIDDYETCAYKYRYSHVLRLPILRHHSVVYGFALHAAVAEFYKAKMAGREISFDSLLEVLENAWVTEGFLTAEHEEKRLLQAKEVLKNFWEREKDNSALPTEIEKDFRFTLHGEDGFKVLVKGRYDRVDETEKEVRIIDFKTVENRDQEKLTKAAQDSIQLKVYSLAYFKNKGKAADFVGIYDLETGLVGGYSPKKKDFEKTEEEIIEVAKKIRNDLQTDNFIAAPKYFGRTPACTYCAYNSICPFSLTK